MKWVKIKMIKFNNIVFVTKELRKEIMKRSKLRNKFNGNRNHENWCNFKFQRNYCVNLRKTKGCNGQSNLLETCKTILQR